MHDMARAKRAINYPKKENVVGRQNAGTIWSEMRFYVHFALSENRRRKPRTGILVRGKKALIFLCEKYEEMSPEEKECLARIYRNDWGGLWWLYVSSEGPHSDILDKLKKDGFDLQRK